MFRNVIKERREKLGLSQTKLACQIGMAESTLSDIERGNRRPWPKVRRALAQALGTSESELFPPEAF